MDRNDASLIFESANIEKMKSFKINGGEVDFGDHLHLGGSPQGNAIVVWSIDGRVAIKGILFSDNFREPQTAAIEIRFRRTNGRFTKRTTQSVVSQGGPMTPFYTTLVETVSPRGSFDEVHIRLSRMLTESSGTPVDTTVATKVLKR